MTIQRRFQIPVPLKGHRALLWPAFILLLALVVLIPAMPHLYYTPDTDTSIFMYIGDKIRHGQFPFRDWYDHKPPLIFYLNALGLSLAQGNRWGVWGIELVSLSAASLLGFTALRRYFGSLVAFIALAATLLNLVFVHQRGNLTEEYALPFQFAVIYFLSNFERAKKSGAWLFLVGAMLAMASSLKQPMASSGVAVAVFLLFYYSGRQAWRSLFWAYIQVGLGFLAVWAAWFLYFAAVGIFGEFWEAAFAYNFALSGISTARRLNALVSAIQMLFGWSGYFLIGMLTWLVVVVYLLMADERFPRLMTSRIAGGGFALVGAFLFYKGAFQAASSPSLDRTVLILLGCIALFCAVAFLMGWVKRWIYAAWVKRQFLSFSPISPLLMIALVDFPVALVFSSLSGNNYPHYFMALLPSLTILFAYLVYSIPRLVNPDTGKPIPYFVLLVFLFPLLSSGVAETADKIGPRGDKQVEQVVAYIKQNTTPEDYILQWGVAPAVNLLSGRDAPSRFFFSDPLFVDGYSGRMQTELLLSELRAKPPVLIIDEEIPRLPLLTAPADQCETVRDPALYQQYMETWTDRVSYVLPQMPEGMDDVYFWVCENYEFIGPIGELGWGVYRLKGK